MTCKRLDDEGRVGQVNQSQQIERKSQTWQNMQGQYDLEYQQKLEQIKVQAVERMIDFEKKHIAELEQLKRDQMKQSSRVQTSFWNETRQPERLRSQSGSQSPARNYVQKRKSNVVYTSGQKRAT